MTLSFSELKFVHKKMIHGRIQGIVDKFDGSMLAGIAEVLIATPFQNDFLTLLLRRLPLQTSFFALIAWWTFLLNILLNRQVVLYEGEEVI